MGPWRAAEDEWRRRLAEQANCHGRLFFRLAVGLLRDPVAAEDVCQQAMLKAWEQKDRIRDHRMLRAWLARVVVNESLQALRGQRREASAMKREATVAIAAGEPTDRQVIIRDGVAAALERLPESVRMVVALRLMDGMSGNEVSQMLGFSVSEVSRQLHQGMDRLRDLLADWREGTGGGDYAL